MTDISLDTETAAASAARWREYADQVEQHGQRQHVALEQLPSLLGDVYAEYTQAKAAEYEARRAAYSRVAAQARAHAEKLDNTRTTFVQADEEAGQRIQQVLAGGAVPEAGDTSGNTVPGPQPIPYSTYPISGMTTQSVPSPADRPR